MSDYTLKILEEDGVCLAKCVIDKYKELITTEHGMHDVADTEYTNYKKYWKWLLRLKDIGATAYQKSQGPCVTIHQ